VTGDEATVDTVQAEFSPREDVEAMADAPET